MVKVDSMAAMKQRQAVLRDQKEQACKVTSTLVNQDRTQTNDRL